VQDIEADSNPFGRARFLRDAVNAVFDFDMFMKLMVDSKKKKDAPPEDDW
jgi:hypothetical protein